MARRNYSQNCALARAIDVIGERWTLLLLRDLLISPRRFKDLLDSLQGIGTNLLASRLKALEAAGIIEQRRGSGVARRYALTDRGRDLEPAILALIRWGLRHGPENRAGDHHRDDWDLLALKALFQPGRAAGLSTTVQFAAADFAGWARIEDRQMRVGIGDVENADLVIGGTIADLFLRAANPPALLTRGDAAALQRFMSAFALRA